MPLPLLKITEAVEAALRDEGIVAQRDSARAALNDAGADIQRLATELSNLVFSAREGVRLNAIRDAFKLHGIDLSTGNSGSGNSNPQITIQVVSENTNLNNVFAPERKF